MEQRQFRHHRDAQPSPPHAGHRGHAASSRECVTTSRRIVQRINAEVGKIRLLPATAEKFKADGAVLSGGTPQAFGNRIAREIAVWRETVSALSIKVE